MTVDQELSAARGKLFGRISICLLLVLAGRVASTFAWANPYYFSIPSMANFGVLGGLMIPAWALLRQGRSEAAAGVLWVGFALYHGLWLGPRTGGIFSTGLLSFQLIMIATSSLIGGKRVAALVAAVCLVNSFFMAFFPSASQIALDVANKDTAMHRLFLHLFFLAGMGAVAWVYAGTLGGLIARAHQIRDDFRSVFMSSPVPMLIGYYDLEIKGSRLMALNPAAEEKFALRAADFLGTPLMELPSRLAVTPEQLAMASGAARDERPMDMGACDMMLAGGGRLRVVASMRPARWMGRPCSMWTIEDVTPIIEAREEAEAIGAELARNLDELVAARASVERANTELAMVNADLERRVEERGAALAAIRAEMAKSESLASLGSLVAGVSHEINTPLGNALLAASSMRGDVASLAGKMAGASFRRADMERFFERAERATSLIEGSLARSAELLGKFKQTASDRSAMARRPFDVGVCAADALALLRPSIESRRIDARFVPGPSISVDSYPGAVGQIVSNLINNALLHAFAPGSSGRIRMWVEEREGAAALIVEDDGLGIPEQIGRKVFEPFFTTKLGQGGTGIGLSISAALARDVLGGSLSIVPMAPGAPGARFEFLMLLVAPEAGTARPESFS